MSILAGPLRHQRPRRLGELSCGRPSPALRLYIENAIEALIALLDATDGEVDLEDGGDTEPIDEREPDDEGDPLDLGEDDPAEGLA